MANYETNASESRDRLGGSGTSLSELHFRSFTFNGRKNEIKQGHQSHQSHQSNEGPITISLRQNRYQENQTNFLVNHQKGNPLTCNTQCYINNCVWITITNERKNPLITINASAWSKSISTNLSTLAPLLIVWIKYRLFFTRYICLGCLAVLGS